MDSNIIELAADKKFTEFEDAIRTELKNKLNNHDTIKKYNSDFDNINKMKDLFSQITKSKN